MVFIGLDLHKRYITACALAASGEVLAEVRRLSTEWDELSAWLKPFESSCTIVMEATLYCWWLERHLTAAGFAVIVVHPYQVKLIWQARTKTDAIDARKLAELARAQLLPAIWVPDLATRTHRQILRGRVFLVRQRTVLKNRIHAYPTAENLRGAQADLFGTAGRAWLAQVSLPRVARHFVDLLPANCQPTSENPCLSTSQSPYPGPRSATWSDSRRDWQGRLNG